MGRQQGEFSPSDLMRIVTGGMQRPAIGQLLNARLAAIGAAVRAQAVASHGSGMREDSSAQPDPQPGLMGRACAAQALTHPLVPVWLWEEEAGGSAPEAAASPLAGCRTTKRVSRQSTRASSSWDLGGASGVVDLGAQLHRLVLVKGSLLGSGAHGVVMAGLLLDPAGSSVQCVCAVKIMSVGYGPMDTSRMAHTRMHGHVHANQDGHPYAEQGQPGLPPAVVAAQQKKAFQMCLSEAEVLGQVGLLHAGRFAQHNRLPRVMVAACSRFRLNLLGPASMALRICATHSC